MGTHRRAFVKDVLAYHVELTDNGGQQWVRQVEAMIQCVDAGRIPRAQYGAIMIDEGHDFEPEWLKLVTQMVDPTTDSLLLLYDDAQSIYRKSRASISACRAWASRPPEELPFSGSTDATPARSSSSPATSPASSWARKRRTTTTSR